MNLLGEPFHIINRLLDQTIGLAVQHVHPVSAGLQRRRKDLAFVAHDLRTPLNAIALAARVLDLTYQEHTRGSKWPRC